MGVMVDPQSPDLVSAVCLDAFQNGQWVPLVGVFKHTVGKRSEEITGQDLDQFLNDTPTPFTVDFNHAPDRALAQGRSPTVEEGRSAGLVRGLRRTGDLLMGLLTLNADGLAEVKSGAYNFLSIVAPRKGSRPIVAVTLTNRPFFAGQTPLSEVMALDVDGMTLQMASQNSAAGEPEGVVPPGVNPPNPKEDSTMDSNLIQALGLEGESSADDALNAVQALTAEIAELKTGKDEAETAKADAEAVKATLETRVQVLENDQIVSKALASNRISPAEQGAARKVLASDGGVALFDTVYPADRQAIPLGEVGSTAAPTEDGGMTWEEASQKLADELSKSETGDMAQILDANPAIAAIYNGGPR